MPFQDSFLPFAGGVALTLVMIGICAAIGSSIERFKNRIEKRLDWQDQTHNYFANSVSKWMDEHEKTMHKTKKGGKK